MELTLFSKHIPIKDISNSESLLLDIVTFNAIKRTAANAIANGKRDAKALARTDPDTFAIKRLERKRRPDMRTKEGRAAKGSDISLHMRLKHKFGTEDHFTNSAVNEAKAAIASRKELAGIYEHDVRSDMEAVGKKLDATNKTIEKRTQLKSSLMDRSKAKKHGLPVPELAGLDAYIRYDNGAGRFYTQLFGVRKREWGNDYLFELWLDGEIRRLKARARSLSLRKEHLEAKLKTIDDREYSVCFGTKKLFGKRDHYPDHGTWLASWRKHRSSCMMASGRSDARQGNFRVRYDSGRQLLTYAAQDGRLVTMPCCFPYGQELVEASVNTSRKERKAVAWRFTVTGGSILVQCIVNAAMPVRENGCFLTGCVSFDTNYDNLSVTDIDGSGNILSHKVIGFDLEGKSSGESGQVLSNALEEIFRMAAGRHKPVAMEDLGIKERKRMYGSKSTNRKLSRFSYSAVTKLADSKSRKFGIHVEKVDPAYTSQSGKVKYCRKYGISAHEAAAAAIGRRAMGFTEKLPAFLKQELTDKQKRLPAIKQWAAVYGITKKLTVSALYRMPMVMAASVAV